MFNNLYLEVGKYWIANYNGHSIHWSTFHQNESNIKVMILIVQ